MSHISNRERVDVLFYIELMVKLGFTTEEIHESVTKNLYNDVMATYLLLERGQLVKRIINKK